MEEDGTMKQYETRIGLEVHVELATKTKLFCSCATAFGAEPNTQICPVCLGLPGALPVLNRKAAEYAVAIGLACGCTITRETLFDRKHYFYPDNPQNYQISQLYAPIAVQGGLWINCNRGKKKIRIRELHLEEDAGKLTHTGQKRRTQIDYNRSGVPLVELVTEPDFETGEEVITFLEKLRLKIQYLGASGCRMQEGSLRVDVNLSVRPLGETVMGVRTEMKNLNSFRSVLAAVEEETKRQIAVLEDGGKIVQETRRWKEETMESVPMRKKETTAEYRYYQDPDLPALLIEEYRIKEIKEKQPEFREEKVERYQKLFGLPEYDAMILTSSAQLAELFEETTALCGHPKEVSNWMMTEIIRLLRENGREADNPGIRAEEFAAFINLIIGKKINRTVAKKVIEQMFLTGTDPETYVRENGLFLENDETLLEDTAEMVLEQCSKSVEDYQNGKEKALGFLIGQTMKALSGKADPEKVGQILRTKLTERKNHVTMPEKVSDIR